MKKLLIIGAAAIAFAVITPIAQVVPDVKRESTVETTPTADLKGSSVRITVREFGLDRRLELNVEIRNVEGFMVDKKVVKLTAAQVKTWVNDANPDAFLESTVLADVSLAKK